MGLFVDKTVPLIVVPVTEATVLDLQSAAGQEKTVVIENLDGANTLTFRFQSSNDNVTFTDVAANATLAPGATIQTVLSGDIFHRIRAFGNLNIAVKASSRLAFNGILHFSNV